MKRHKLSSHFLKKRSFILIEILAAIAIISLVSFPLIRNPIYFCMSQIRSLEKMECVRIADLTFLEIKLAFIKNEIPMESIVRYEKEAQIIKLRSAYIPPLKNKEIKRSYKCYSKSQKRTVDDQIVKLVNVKIYLQPKDLKDSYSYKYRIVYKAGK